MTDEEYLKDAREHLSGAGQSEVALMEDLPGAEDLWKDIQDLKQEMNAAKRKAADEAAAPYLVKLKELEDQYAFVLKLSS